MVFTGAGISAESGLQTFRDSNGLWNDFKVEDVATPEAWAANPEIVLQFYNDRRKQAFDAIPNAAHEAVTRLEEKYEVIVVTQNVDGLHERSESTNVIHVHGQLKLHEAVKMIHCFTYMMKESLFKLVMFVMRKANCVLM